MSVVRQIRTVYTISCNTFIFIIWAFLLNIFVGLEVKSNLYLITLVNAFFLQFLLNKLTNRRAALLISAAAVELATYLLIGSSNFIYNSIFNMIAIAAAKLIEEEEINYEGLKLRGKQWLLAILIIGLFAAILNLEISSKLLRFYLTFLISILIVLREGRNYFYGIKNNKTAFGNIVMAAFIIFISSEFIFVRFLQLLKYLYGYLNLFLNLVINLISIIMKVPLELMMNFLSKKHADKPGLFQMVAGDKEITYDNLIAPAKALPKWLNVFLETVILIILSIIVYKIFLSFKNRKRNKGTSLPLMEDREKIISAKSKQSLLEKIVNKIFKPSSFREQILNIYKKFQKNTFEKGIYKEHMTAKQLENITKTYIENTEGLVDLTNIYNEAKFSLHGIGKEDVEAAKENYSRVKKQL